MNLPDTRLRIGLIGAGGIANAHVGGFRRNPGKVVFAAVADPVRKNADRFVAEFNPVLYNDYHTMIEDAGIDAVDICLPHHLHKDAILAAAAAGKHVLCEKPLCLTVEEAREITAAVEKSGITVMCAHNQLFLPPVARARELLDAGLLGTIYNIRTTDSFFNDFTRENMGWRARAASSGGGALIDTGYHPSYLLLYLAGSKPVEATAMLSTHRLTFMEGEDSAQVLVRFRNGVMGSVVTSWASEASANTERFSVVGELGSMYSDGESLTYILRGKEPVTETFEWVHEFAAEVEHFADSIANGTAPIHSHTQGIEVLGMILAAYESASTKSIVPVRGVLEDPVSA
jgi:predicted dehydrogenase